MNSSQHKATPPAGSTRLFHSACDTRAVRQRTNPSQSTVPITAATKASQEKSAWVPGTSLVIRSAVRAGAPVCSAT